MNCFHQGLIARIAALGRKAMEAAADTPYRHRHSKHQMRSFLQCAISSPPSSMALWISRGDIRQYQSIQPAESPCSRSSGNMKYECSICMQQIQIGISYQAHKHPISHCKLGLIPISHEKNSLSFCRW
ncbi:uncharacterized protein TrAtP1_013340 [Trichoderma atroviride]|uniref:uncharacterized protein n=1 Tax=Hypocrea atroviridis TaxID=63577 RepID=UPI003330BC45|nr:hypothetical protein TrAtP1_013340 [Trichoderma atroviride]